MKPFKTLLLTAAMLAVVPGVAAAQDTGSEEMTIDDAPAWVADTADRAVLAYFAGGAIETVQLDKEGPLPTFEFGGTTADGATFEVDVFPDGTIDEVELIIPADQVPAQVAAVFAAQFPEFTVESIEQSLRPGKNGLWDVWYEWGGTNAGADLDVEINEAGTAMLVELPAAS